MQPVPNSQNAFQIQITDFASQKHCWQYGKPGGVIPITDNPLALDEVLAEKGLTFNADNITQISLRRDGISYIFFR